eukprot:13726812-Ditylum_brightwellii.AAC.1
MGAIEIDNNDAYTPINPSVSNTEKWVYNLRSRKGQDNEESKVYHMVREDLDDMVHYALTQYSLKQGSKKLQKEGEHTVKEEFLQLHQKETFKPIAPNELTAKQKTNALKSLMFIMKKRCGRIKAQGCTAGRKQRDMYTKEEAASTTISLKAVLLMSVIGTKEG